MSWTADALSRCACGHSPAAHEQRGQDGAALLDGCGLCGCESYDPRADAAAERGHALAWDLTRRLRHANGSRERLQAVALAATEGGTEAVREALAALRDDDLTPGEAGRGADA